ncbi:ribonuclease HII [Halovivax limisalsi]|uniref:ribonuclease HII n=1 Tax=Halovivax limisalsi TaxID=1453760 RepID=UPI001FFC75CD|nr:ribonuclease HII [Halovivax limisalsi]
MRFGVDEAGKGPAIGPMVAAAVHVDRRDRLPEGIADSKDLAQETRESLSQTLRADDGIAVGVAVITPARIDAPETDMNGLAVEAHVCAIEAALNDAGIEATADDDLVPRGVCDACDTDADRFARRVADGLARDASIDAFHGADAADPLVGAASIVAKVERDARIERLAASFADEGYDEIGSGYPSDPTTRTFLETYVADHGRLPDGARETWSTCEEVLAATSQTDLGDFGE